MVSPLVFVFAMLLMTTSHRPVEQGALLSCSKKQLPTLYLSFPLQVPTLRILRKHTFASLQIFFLKTTPALLLLGTCSWMKKSLAPASLCSRTGVCPNKWDTPTCETVLVFISKSVSFFPALNSLQILSFYLTFLLICLPVA